MVTVDSTCVDFEIAHKMICYTGGSYLQNEQEAIYM